MVNIINKMYLSWNFLNNPKSKSILSLLVLWSKDTIPLKICEIFRIPPKTSHQTEQQKNKHTWYSKKIWQPLNYLSRRENIKTLIQKPSSLLLRKTQANHIVTPKIYLIRKYKIKFLPTNWIYTMAIYAGSDHN